jgi:hypothetical protein
MDWINVAQPGDGCQAVEKAVMNRIKCRVFLDWLQS